MRNKISTGARPPEIVEPTKQSLQYVVKQTNVTLTCEATGDPKPE